MIRLLKFILLLTLVTVLGCATPPLSIDGLPLKRVTALDDQQVFAATSDGEKVAYLRGTLYLRDITTQETHKLADDVPERLAWNPQKTVLATIFRETEFESRLVQYSYDGTVLFEIRLPIAATKINWTARGDLLVCGYTLEIYSFGGNLQQLLYSITGDSFHKTVLADTTLKPHLAKSLKPEIEQYLPILFTGYGDELFFVSVHDPPEFPPYLNLFTLNWQGGEQRLLHKFPLRKLRLRQTLHDDSAVVEYGQNEILVHSWPLITDEELNDRAGHTKAQEQLFTFHKSFAERGSGYRFQLLDDGRYLLATDRALYLGRGLHGESRRGYSDERWTLRRWRAAGLISHDEYIEKVRTLTE